MLFMALTRSGLVELMVPHSARQFSVVPGWFLIVVTDNFPCRLSVSKVEIIVAESLLVDSESKPRHNLHYRPFLFPFAPVSRISARFMRLH
jgi:hypothetical protein